MRRHLTRRGVIAAGLAGLGGIAGLSGCAGGDSTGGAGGYGGGAASTPTTTPSNPARGDAAQLGNLALSSPAFADGAAIPRRYGGREENVNPPLRIEDVPDDATSLALVMDDPDAKPVAGKVWIHWLVWNIAPDRAEIPEDWAPEAAVEGTNSGGNVGYGGPAPPDEEHTYRFKLYALDTTLDLGSGAEVDELGHSMSGHVLARTQLDGTHAP